MLNLPSSVAQSVLTAYSAISSSSRTFYFIALHGVHHHTSHQDTRTDTQKTRNLS